MRVRSIIAAVAVIVMSAGCAAPESGVPDAAAPIRLQLAYPVAVTQPAMRAAFEEDGFNAVQLSATRLLVRNAAGVALILDFTAGADGDTVITVTPHPEFIALIQRSLWPHAEAPQ